MPARWRMDSAIPAIPIRAGSPPTSFTNSLRRDQRRQRGCESSKRSALRHKTVMTVASTSREVLAIHGGSPVRNTLLPYGHHSISEDDIQAVVETLRSDWLTTGPKVAEFEEAMAAWVGAKHAVSFSSGTAALHGAA